jgi:hypothetical protein
MACNDFQSRPHREPNPFKKGIPKTDAVYILISCVCNESAAHLVAGQKAVQDRQTDNRRRPDLRRRRRPLALWRGFDEIADKPSAKPPGNNLLHRLIGLSFSAAEISGKYASFVMHKCSRHCPTLQHPCAGCQLSCSSPSPLTSFSARSSLALRLSTSRMCQTGCSAVCAVAIVFPNSQSQTFLRSIVRQECARTPVSTKLSRERSTLRRSSSPPSRSAHAFECPN